MDHRLLSTAKGVITITLFAVNVVFWFIPIFLLALLKLLVPVRSWTAATSRWLMAMGENWISANKAILGLTQSIEWDIRGTEILRRREWYLVISNHQSWVDILVLQAVFNRRIAFLKFFIKQELVWVPFLGFAWWAMDMPFMKRHSKEFLARHPELRGQDLETTRRACEKFRATPTSVINFVEGTRVSEAKQAKTGSRYRNLLPPRAGGIAFVLAAMGGILHKVVDVTIVYGERAPSLWDLCCGRVNRIVVHVTERDIEGWMTQGDYPGDEVFKARFQQWLADVWTEKDHLIASIKAEPGF